MKVPYETKLATELVPESCTVARKDVGEALTGAGAGRVLSHEIVPPLGMPTSCLFTEGNTRRPAKARAVPIPRGRRPRARIEALHTEPGRSQAWSCSFEGGRVRTENPKGASR